MEKGYKNITYLFLVLLVCVFIGFFKTYFGLFPKFDESTTFIVHVHAFVLTLWVVLLVVQPILIRTKKYKLHRLIGKFSYFLVPIIVLTFLAMMHKQYNEGIVQKIPKSENLKNLYVPGVQVVFFVLFYILAMVNKHNLSKHLRYIISTALVIIPPILARTLFYGFKVDIMISIIASFVVPDLILLTLILVDKRNSNNFKPYLLTLALFILYNIGWTFFFYPTNPS